MGASDHGFVATKFRGGRRPCVMEIALRQVANDSTGIADSQLVCGTVSNYKLPAPMTVLSPIVTPGQMTQLPPSQTLFPMATGLAAS